MYNAKPAGKKDKGKDGGGCPEWKLGTPFSQLKFVLTAVSSRRGSGRRGREVVGADLSQFKRQMSR